MTPHPAPAPSESAQTSRLVREFKVAVVRCLKCGRLPVESTLTLRDVTHHRFECPQCDNPLVRWEWSHRKAARVWKAENTSPRSKNHER